MMDDRIKKCKNKKKMCNKNYLLDHKRFFLFLRLQYYYDDN